MAMTEGNFTHPADNFTYPLLDISLCLIVPLEDNSFSTAAIRTARAFEVLLMIFIIPGNLLMVVGLFKTNQVKGFPNKMFIFLCLSDLMVGTITIPLSIYSHEYNWLADQNCYYVAFYNFFSIFPPFLSAGIIWCIAINRAINITRPIFYRKYFERKSVLILTIILPVFPAVTIAAYNVSISNEFTSYEGMRRVYILMFCYIFIISVSLMASYAVLLRYIRRQAKKIRTALQNPPRNHNKKSIKTVVIIWVCLAVTYTPINIYTLVVASISYEENYNGLLYVFYNCCTKLTFVNSATNALIFMYRNKKLKQYYNSVISGSVSEE